MLMIGSGDMYKWFTKTNIGYSHKKNKKPCQDYSASFHDEERTIITACDGHGGDLYIRSDRGSKFASIALTNAFKSVTRAHLKKSDDDLLKYIKIYALSEWNRLVEEDLSKNPIKTSERKKLDEDNRFKLKMNPVKAYGTTMIGAMIIQNKVIIIELGDGGSFIIKRNVCKEAVLSDDDTVANITYSMCGDDVYKHMHGAIYNKKDIDSVLICTDGVLNPYQSYDNFYSSFVLPILKLIKDGKDNEVEAFIKELGLKSGIGDDVSLGILMK